MMALGRVAGAAGERNCAAAAPTIRAARGRRRPAPHRRNKKQANQSRFPKGKNLVKDVAEWLVEMEAKQTLKGDQVVGSGHTFAKEKFNSKAAFDVAYFAYLASSSPLSKPTTPTGPLDIVAPQVKLVANVTPRSAHPEVKVDLRIASSEDDESDEDLS